MRLNIFVWALNRMVGAIEIEIYFVSCLSPINLWKWNENENEKKYRMILRPWNKNHKQKCLSACA
jgi:hypothetical protein